jgi:uncharacterized protein YndB with AHSA1/START domain
MTDRVATATMLIRCTVAEAFDAFANPEKVTQFWLESTSGPLQAGAEVRWSFLVPGSKEVVRVTEFLPPHRIGFDWSDGIHVSLSFQEQGPGATRVSVEATGFGPDKGTGAIVNATEGFAIVLCDLKTLLEGGRSANLVRDKAVLIAASRDPR